MITTKKRQPQTNLDRPSMERMLESAYVKRCPVCWRIWQADAITQEDGQDRCPSCVSNGRSETEKAETLSREAQFVATRILQPQISQAPLDSTFPGTIREITDENGTRVYQGAPLQIYRTVAKTLLLLGRDFSASDTITGASGLTITVSTRTATQTDLSITADVSMTPGEYALIFNDVYFHNVLRIG
jgi:hypothetical protein